MSRVVQVGPDSSLPGGMRTVMLSLQSPVLAACYGMEIVGTASNKKRVMTFLKGFSCVKTLVKSGACDCLHIHMSENASVFRTALILRWLKANSCSHAIVHSHGSSVQAFFARCPHFAKRYLLKSLELADCFVVLTPGWEAWWRTLLPAMKISVIPNGVEISCGDVELRHPNETVLFLGQLGERKGTYLLLDAAKSVLRRRPACRFVFAGNGELERCRSYADRRGIGKSCDFVGWVDAERKDELLREASLLVLPSREESFGIVLLEAMVRRVPVVCSDGGFMHEIVDDGTDGIVFPTEDIGALADAICWILDDSELGRRMGEKGRAKVEASYSMEHVLHMWNELYGEIIA